MHSVHSGVCRVGWAWLWGAGWEADASIPTIWAVGGILGPHSSFGSCGAGITGNFTLTSSVTLGKLCHFSEPQ